MTASISWLAVGPERRQACGAHRKHGDGREAHWRAADVPAAFRLGRRNLARMFFTMMIVITAATSEAARAKLEPKVQICDQSALDYGSFLDWREGSAHLSIPDRIAG